MPNYTYTQDIPLGTNNPSVDAPNMKVNTNSIASIVDVDLIGFGDNNGGYHQKSTYVVQGSDPSSASGQIIEYSKAASGNSELYLVRDNSGSPFQFTRGSPGTNGNGSYSFLPGGFLIQWGAGAASSHTLTVTFPIAFTSAPIVTATVRALSGNYYVATIRSSSNTGCVINEQNGSQTVNWIAIGT